MKRTEEILSDAKGAVRRAACLDCKKKNEALYAMADALVEDTELILEANRADVERARGTVSEVMLDRLTLTKQRIAAMADGRPRGSEARRSHRARFGARRPPQRLDD